MNNQHMFGIAGSGGGGKSGGGGGGISEDPDSLSSVAVVRFIDLIGEGEIVGLANGEQSIYLDGVPLRTSEGTPNYKPFEWLQTKGTPDQDVIPGFAGTQSEQNVSIKVTKTGGQIIRAITDSDADAVRVTVSVPALVSTSSDGKITGTSVSYRVKIRQASGSWVIGYEGSISGKTNSKYQRSHEVVLTTLGAGPFEVAVERVTDDSGSGLLSNDLWWDSFTVMNYEQFAYPNSACIAIGIDARYFSSVPKRQYHVKGLIVQVPTNYDPVTRKYTGNWDGNFKWAYTNNPAWCYYALCTNRRFGLGKRLAQGQVSKWALYNIGKYCDEMVPTGFGETFYGFNQGAGFSTSGEVKAGVPTAQKAYEPRFTVNCVINTFDDAYRVLNNLASVFRGMTYWGNNEAVPVQDRPGTVSMIWNNANVIDGTFRYEGSSRANRHTVVTVGWNDPAEDFKQKYEYIEDRDGIARYGVRPVEIVAFGCTSRSQARRAGLYLLYTERIEGEVVNFTASLDSARVNPGDIGEVADSKRIGARWGGRVLSSTTTKVTLDAPVDLTVGAYTLNVMAADGTVTTKSVNITANGSYSQLTVTAAFTTAPSKMAMWTLASAVVTPMKVRVLSVKYAGDNLFEISALEHDPSKYNAIDNGGALIPQNYSFLSYNAVPDIIGLTAAENSYKPTLSAATLVNIDVSWNMVTDPLLRGYGMKLIRVVGGKDSEYIPLPESTQSAKTIENVAPGTYKVQVWAVNAFGIAGSVATSPVITVTGKDTKKPGNVTNLVPTVVQGGVKFKWDKLNDPSYLKTELHIESTWNDSTASLFSGNADTYTWPWPAAGTYTIVAKHQDTSLNWSASATGISVTVGANLQIDWSNVGGVNKPADGATRNVTYKQDADPGGQNGDTWLRTSGGVVIEVYLKVAGAWSLVPNGLSTLTVEVYRQSSTAPAAPTGGTYNFSTDTLVAPSGWTRAMPANSATPTYRAAFTFSTSIVNATLTGGTWTSPVIVAQNGTSGNNGTSVYTATVYKQSATVPATPSGGSYNFSTGTLTPPSGWTVAQPTTTTTPTYASETTFSTTTPTTTVNAGTWTTPVVDAVAGAQGPQGPAGTGAFNWLVSGTCVASGPDVSKPTGVNAWDSDARSVERFINGAFMSFRAAQTNMDFMMGLTDDTVSDSSYTSIGWAWNCDSAGNASIYVSGTQVASGWTYSTTTSLTVIYDGDTIKFQRGNSVVHTINVGPNLVLRMDSSFNTVGATAKYVSFGAAGAKGDSGIPGSNSAQVILYKRSATVPAVPSATVTYTFATGAASGVNNGWTTSVPAGTNPLYVTLASAVSTGPTDTIGTAEWATPVVLAQDGVNGTDGFNSATVYLFQRTSTNVAPADPTANVTYTFSTGVASGLTGGWTQSMPATGGAYRWVITASAVSTGATDSITPAEWAPAALMAQDGVDGVDGVNGLNTAQVFIYRRATSAPALPSAASTYDFAAKTLTGLTNGWTSSVPAGTSPLYVSSATASSVNSTDSIAAAEWVTPVVMVQNGTDGGDGLNNATVYLFKRTTTSASPALPTANITYDFSTGAATGLTNGWTQALPTTGGKYRWVTTAAALSATGTDIIAVGDWATPSILSEDGDSAATASLSTSSVNFPAYSDGVVQSYAGGSTSMTVNLGSADDTANWTFSHTKSNAAITTTATGTPAGSTVTITSIPSSIDTGWIDISATRSGFATQTKRLTFGKNKSSSPSSGPVPSPGNFYAFDLEINPTDATAYVEFRTDGSVWGIRSNALVKFGDWYLPNTTNIGSSYQVMFKPVANSSPFYTNQAASFVTLSANKRFTATMTGVGDADVDFTYTVQRLSDSVQVCTGSGGALATVEF